jgi:hypothetical protein
LKWSVNERSWAFNLNQILILPHYNFVILH